MTIRLTVKMLRYPAADRNKDAILDVFMRILTNEGTLQKQMKALEIGSGSGQHITHLAHHLPNIEWQPSDVDNRLFESIEGYTRAMGLRNVFPPIHLDVSEGVTQWPIPQMKLDLMVCINVIHISPWKCTEGLFRGCSSLLKPNSLLLTYGPYATDGVLTPESNINFDWNLRQQNPEWGVRDIRDLKILAEHNGLSLVAMYEMPANNKILVFRKVD